jgi:hypothetical protein
MLGWGKSSKLGEPSQTYFAQMSFEQMSLRANVTQPTSVGQNINLYLNSVQFFSISVFIEQRILDTNAGKELF